MGAFVAFLILLVFAFFIVLYFLMAYGLYKMGRNAGVKHSWLAFFPILSYYVMGKILCRLKIGRFTISCPEIVLPIALVVAGNISHLPTGLAFLVLIAVMVISISATYQFFKLYRPEKASLYTVLSTVIPFFFCIFVFMLRNETPQYDDEENSYNDYDYYNYYNNY